MQPSATLIVADGEKPSLDLLNRHRRCAKHVIALDGASLWLRDHGAVPDIIIGDFDSSPIVDADNVTRHFVDDQNTNDLHKALSYCVDRGFHDVTVLGAFGLRADHFLTNLCVMARFCERIMIRFVDDQQIALICPTNRDIVFKNCSGDFLSLFPLGDEVGPVTSTGVQYPLSTEMLSLQSRLGTLNRISDDNARIRCVKGALVIVTAWRT